MLDRCPRRARIGIRICLSSRPVLTAGAGLTAGAMFMAAGENVSAVSQRDAERTDVTKESRELANDPDGELLELTRIYRPAASISCSLSRSPRH